MSDIRRRVEAIERYLQAGGIGGKLTVTPGSSEGTRGGKGSDEASLSGGASGDTSGVYPGYVKPDGQVAGIRVQTHFEQHFHGNSMGPLGGWAYWGDGDGSISTFEYQGGKLIAQVLYMTGFHTGSGYPGPGAVWGVRCWNITRGHSVRTTAYGIQLPHSNEPYNQRKVIGAVAMEIPPNSGALPINPGDILGIQSSAVSPVAQLNGDDRASLMWMEFPTAMLG